LFNLKNDPAETQDVSADNAEQAAKMKKLLQEARNAGYTRPSSGA
jgi:hypothetical protein